MFIAWRNLRRTWLTSGAIAFSIFLILFSRSVVAGRYLGQSRATGNGRDSDPVGELIMGRSLARNLGAQLGDEVVLLGTQKDSSVAALVLKMKRAYHMPDRLYPGWSWSWASAFEASWVLLLATQLAAFFSTVKVRKLIPVEAMFRRV